MPWRILKGDCRDVLRELPERCAHTVITSPPYFGLRDYGHEGQIGLEPTPDEFVAALVGVFREVRRVLRDDGTVWLNLGDSYAAARTYQVADSKHQAHDFGASNATKVPDGMKPKDLIGVPWMVAFALRADGWYLRSDIIWAKPNPMPESVRDRPTSAHEHIFLLAKRPTYYYDSDAIRESAVSDHPSGNGYARDERETYRNGDCSARGQAQGWTDVGGQRNKRNVWTINPAPFAGAHFAAFPPKLIEPCVLAGCPEGGTVLDPFAGAGTTGMVALRHNRSFIGIELNPEYAEMARWRIRDDAPLLNSASEEAAA